MQILLVVGYGVAYVEWVVWRSCRCTGDYMFGFSGLGAPIEVGIYKIEFEVLGFSYSENAGITTEDREIYTDFW